MSQNPETPKIPKSFERASDEQASRFAQEAEVLVSVLGWVQEDDLKMYQEEDMDLPPVVQDQLHTGATDTVVKDSLAVETIWNPRATMASLAGITFRSRESQDGSDSWTDRTVSYYVQAQPIDPEGRKSLESMYVFSKNSHINEYKPGGEAEDGAPHKFVAPSKEVFREMLRQAELTTETERLLGLKDVSAEEAEQLITYLARLTAEGTDDPTE